MATSKFSITQKETEALARKLQIKAKSLYDKEFTAAAKKLEPKAREVLELVKKIPDSVAKELLSYSCRNNSISIREISKLLVDKTKLTAKVSDIKDYEVEVTLAANGCRSLADLCRKLGV